MKIPRPQISAPRSIEAERHMRDVLPAVDGVTRGLDVVTALVMVLAVHMAIQEQTPMVALLAIMQCATFTFVYYFGTRARQRWTFAFELTWVLILTVVWLSMLPTVHLAVYLVFPLYFLFLTVIPGWQGVATVIAATAVAVASQIPGGLTPGGVVGPIMAALITVAISYALRALWRSNYERERLIDQLVAAREELARTQLEAGRAAERQHIAHEIHDTLAQGLSSIQMLLNVAESEISQDAPERALERIQLARATAADNLAEARAMIGALQPAALQDAGFDAALGRVAETTAARSGIDIDVDVEGEVRRLPMRQEAALLRIAQGALGNVVKHSAATRARITLTYEPDEVRLDIVDNGRGFDPVAVAARPAGLGHIGISALRERAREAGGHLDIESAPGEGTAVSVALPARMDKKEEK